MSWNTPDPAAITGPEGHVRIAFAEAYGKLHARLQGFLSLQLEHLEDRVLLQSIAGIGERRF